MAAAVTRAADGAARTHHPALRVRPAMSPRVLAFPVAVLLLAVAPASAQTRLGLSVGSGGPDGGRPETYVALTGGGAVRTGPLVLAVGVESGAVLRDPVGGRYAYDPDSFDLTDAGEYLCQDLRTGAYVRPGACGDEVSLRGAVTADASLLVPRTGGLSVGGGYRLGYAPTPYATLGYAVGGHEAGRLRFDLQVSQRLTQVGASVRFGR